MQVEESDDIVLPEEMKRIIGKQAEAEREKRSVIIKAEGELMASANMAKAAQMLTSSEGALHLRTLQSINDISSDKSNTIVFAVPLEILRAFERFGRKLSEEEMVADPIFSFLLGKLTTSFMTNQSAVVGIVPRKNLWDVIQGQRWYHIPVESAPKNAAVAEYLGFYFPAVFGDKLKYKVSYYAKVKKVDVVKRIYLFPKEAEHKRADKDYFQFHLEKIEKLPKPISSAGCREIVHIHTTYEKLFTASELNDLYETSPLEEKMYLEMKKRKIQTERQLYVKANGQYFCLDFAIFCGNRKLDIECDGEEYHTLPEALTKDRQRNNQLNSLGWNVLRFTGEEIHRTLQDCFGTIETTIRTLGGVSSTPTFLRV